MQYETKTIHTYLWLALGMAFLLLIAILVASYTQTNFFMHSPYDSYTLQAYVAWREGRLMLPQDYPWLELAVFEGNYYVSFPPVPTIPMWVLTFFFGYQTPSALVVLLYWLAGYAVLFLLLRRTLPPAHAAVCAVFCAAGGSLLDLAVSDGQFAGSVWYMAQMLAFLLTALAFWGVDGKSRAGWAMGLVCIALAVGCRPLNAMYVPALLWMLYRKQRADALLPTLRRVLPYIAVPALIACAYGIFNYARFGNPFEFGHRYLPEYTESGDAVFSLANIPRNLQAIFRLPSLQTTEGLVFPIHTGFAVYLTNPMLFLGAARSIERTNFREGDRIGDALLGATVLIHSLALLMHRTNGGWQYGTRYLCDALPAVSFLFARGGRPLRIWEVLSIGALLAFNVYATVVFHLL